MKNFLVKGFKLFLNLLYPKYITCCFCNEELGEKGLICDKCRGEISFIEKGCGKCGAAVISGDYCVRCKSAKFDFERAVAVCDYNDFAKNIIYRFKNGDKYLFEPLARLMTEKVKSSGLSLDLVACVPVTRKVQKRRGYNQSELLMRHIAKELDLPCHTAFFKTKDSDFQKNITAAKRRQNIKGVFKLNEKGAVKDKNVLIIDDVITTGSTLGECARVFKNAGAKNVYGCAFAAVQAKIALN